MLACQKTHDITSKGSHEKQKAKAAVHRNTQKELVEIWTQALWTEGKTINLYQNDEKWKMWRMKGNAYAPKPPPHLSNTVVVMARAWMAAKWTGTHWHLLMISLLTDARGWMQRYTGAFLELTFSQMHQNSLDDISSFSRATILNILPKQQKSFSLWRGGISSTGWVSNPVSIWLSCSPPEEEEQTKGRSHPTTCKSWRWPQWRHKVSADV